MIFGLAFPIRTTHNLGREPADRAAFGLGGSYPTRRTRLAWSEGHPPRPEPPDPGHNDRGPHCPKGSTFFFGLAYPFWATHNLGRAAAARAAVGLWGSFTMRRT